MKGVTPLNVKSIPEPSGSKKKPKVTKTEGFRKMLCMSDHLGEPLRPQGMAIQKQH